MNRFEFNSNLINFKNKQDELAHYGTRGQKWGVRKWQNYDGTFNEAGKERYFGSKKSETFGSKKTPEEKERIRQEKFDKKVNYWVNRQKKQIERYNKNPFHKNKQINIDDDTLKGYYESLWSLPWYKRTHKNAIEEYKKKNGITMTDEDIKNLKKMHDADSQNRMNQINRLNEQMRQAEELNRMSQLNQLNQLDQQMQEIDRINQINQLNQIEQINQINQINQLNQLQQIEQMNQINQLNQLNTMNQINMINQMMMPGFMGKPSKEEKKAAEEAQKINDAFHGNYEQLSEAIRTLYNDKKFDEVYKNVGNAVKEKYKNEFDEIEKIYGDFDDVEDEYLALAGLNSAIMYNDGKMKDIAYVPYLYLEEDLNQGNLTAEAIWAYDNGINDSWDKWDHMNEIEKNAKNDMTNEFTNNKSYESKVVKNLDDYIKDSIKSHIWNNEVVPHSYWTLYNAGDTTKDEYDSVKDTSLKEARNISKKLQPSCGNDVNGWYYLNQAIDNLNMGDISYKDLTDADWNRINAEVDKLKK